MPGEAPVLPCRRPDGDRSASVEPSGAARLRRERGEHGATLAGERGAGRAGTALPGGARERAGNERARDGRGAARGARYRVETPRLIVPGVRPHEVDGGVCVYQLFGDYEPATAQIRVFLRTAIKGQIVRPRAFLCTLLHEFCHHLDLRFFGRRSSYHTRGFFGRVDDLYHRALGTPEAERRPLRWVQSGEVWRIDWPATRAPRR
jgi:hypothetical protein